MLFTVVLAMLPLPATAHPAMPGSRCYRCLMYPPHETLRLYTQASVQYPLVATCRGHYGAVRENIWTEYASSQQTSAPLSLGANLSPAM